MQPDIKAEATQSRRPRHFTITRRSTPVTAALALALQALRTARQRIHKTNITGSNRDLETITVGAMESAPCLHRVQPSRSVA